MTKHWAQRYIGLPWASGAKGPESFDCWGLVQDVYWSRLGVKLPDMPGLAEIGIGKLRRLVETQMPLWRTLHGPVDLSVVAISSGRAYTHVGVWLQVDQGLVLHSMRQTGVVAQSRASLRAVGLGNLLFFAYGSHH